MSNSRGDVRRRLQDAAIALFLEHGFDATTAAGIAARAGVTERTFFRYFPDKRDVLFGDEAKLHLQLEPAIRAAPPGLGALDAILWALQSLVPAFEANRPSSGPAQAIIARTPALQERQLTKAASTTLVIADALRRRGIAPDLATLAAATGIAVGRHALERWLRRPATPLGTHFTAAFCELHEMTRAGPSGGDGADVSSRG